MSGRPGAETTGPSALPVLLTGRASNRMAAISWMDLSLKVAARPALLLRSAGVVSASQMLAVDDRRMASVEFS